MSFELFVTAFKNGEAFSYPTKLIEEIFNRGAVSPSTPLSYVEYEDGHGQIDGAEADETDGIVLSHFGGRTVLERVLELAAKTGSVILWPGDPPWIVADLGVIEHLPDDLSADEYVAVTDVDRLIEVIGLV